MEWQDLVFQGAMTVALTAWIKHLAKDKLGQWAVAVTVGVAFVIVFLAMNGEIVSWTDFVKQSLYVGLGSAGFYKGAQRISGN